MVSNVEWLNENAGRNFPIREDMSRYPVTSGGVAVTDFQFPNFVIVDFLLTVPTDSQPAAAYLATVLKAGTLLTLVFNTDSGIRLASVTIDTSAHVRNQAYYLSGYAPYEDSRGMIVIGDLSNLSDVVPDGVYNFSMSTAAMETTVIRPDVRGVRSIQINDQDNLSEKLYGDVTLISGNNIRMTYDSATNSVLISAISGDNMDEQCACSQYTAKNNIVRLVNGRPIDEVIIAEGECISASMSGNTLTLTDTCSKPCCGCPELESITVALRNLEISVQNIKTSVDQLNVYVTDFVKNVVMLVP